jgi:hypothetical protein
MQINQFLNHGIIYTIKQFQSQESHHIKKENQPDSLKEVKLCEVRARQAKLRKAKEQIN